MNAGEHRLFCEDGKMKILWLLIIKRGVAVLHVRQTTDEETGGQARPFPGVYLLSSATTVEEMRRESSRHQVPARQYLWQLPHNRFHRPNTSDRRGIHPQRE